MMNYPKNYAVMTEEEMVYTTGGSTGVGVLVLSSVLMVGGLAGAIVSSAMYNNKLNQIKAELKAESPEEYSSSDDMLADMWRSSKLDVDAQLRLETSGEGLTLNIAQSVAGTCFGLGFMGVIFGVAMKQAGL